MELDISFFCLTDFPLFIFLQFLRQKLIDPGLIFFPLRNKFFQLFLLNNFDIDKLRFGSIQLLILSQNLISHGFSNFVLSFDIHLSSEQLLAFLFFASEFLLSLAHDVLEFLNFFNFSTVIFLELLFLLLEFDFGPMLVIFAFLLDL